MKIENPLAFRYILQDDVYLLNSDKLHFEHIAVYEPAVETPAIRINYLGGNKKKFLVLVDYNDIEFMHEQHLRALENTLKRLSFELDDVAIFNTAGNKQHVLETLIAFFKPEILLILGKSAIPIGAEQLTLNRITNVNNCKVLHTFNFDQMMDNTENKKSFWEQMKQIS